MHMIDYEKTKKKIKDYLDSRVIFDVEIKGEAQGKEFDEISKIFGESLKSDGYLKNFRRLYVDSHTIYSYDVISPDKQKQVNYIACCEYDNPLFLISYSKNGNNKVEYTEEEYAIYSSDTTKHLDARLKVKNTLFANNKIIDINLLNKKKYDYCSNDYEFYYDNGELVTLQVRNDKFFDFYYARLNIVEKEIELISKKLESRIDYAINNVEEEVKKYKIKRK